MRVGESPWFALFASFHDINIPSHHGWFQATRVTALKARVGKKYIESILTSLYKPAPMRDCWWLRPLHREKAQANYMERLHGEKPNLLQIFQPSTLRLQEKKKKPSDDSRLSHCLTTLYRRPWRRACQLSPLTPLHPERCDNSYPLSLEVFVTQQK